MEIIPICKEDTNLDKLDEHLNCLRYKDKFRIPKRKVLSNYDDLIHVVGKDISTKVSQ